MTDPRKEENILFSFRKKPSKSNSNEDTYKRLETKSKKEFKLKKGEILSDKNKFTRKNKNIINQDIHLSYLLFLNDKKIQKGKKDIKTVNRNNNINKKEDLNKRQLMTRNYFFLNNPKKLNKTNYLIIILYLNLFFNNNLTTEKAILLNSSNITIKINNSGTQKTGLAEGSLHSDCASAHLSRQSMPKSGA